MSRARQKWQTSHGLRIGAVAVAAFGCVAGAIAADAEESTDREILIGTMRLGGPQVVLIPDRGRSEDPIEATALLETALGELDSGHLARAQRHFELLVARYPDTAAATRARRHLAELYGRLDASRSAAAPAAVKPVAHAAPPRAQPRTWSTQVHPGAVRTDPGRTLGQRLRLEVGDRVFFGPGSADLGARAHAVLAGQAEWLKRQPELIAVVEGHADDPGPVEENLRLASARAEAVRQRLVSEGVSPARVSVQAAGDTSRVAICGDPACAAQNRRAVTVVHAPGAPAQGRRPGAAESAEALPRPGPIAGEPARGSRLPR